MRRAAPQVGGFRPDPPRPDALVAWPAEFGQRFTIMVDTEEEFDWSKPFSRDARATTAAGAIPAAARRFADNGAAPTYLVDYPIVTDPYACEALACVIADGRSAIGAQLHPWVNPPLAHDRRATDSYASNLSVPLHTAKLDVLTEAIERAFARRPVIYRAGRYGLGAATLRLLAERGYRFDCSMRARYDYREVAGPDYRAIGNAAFRTGPGGSIVELPFTTVFIGAGRRFGPFLHRWASGVEYATGALARAGILSRVSLTPEEMPVDEALEAIRIAAGEGLALLNFAFHSPSLVPGHTPYVRDAADLLAFWRWWDQVFALLARLHIGYATLDEIDRAARRVA